MDRDEVMRGKAKDFALASRCGIGISRESAIRLMADFALAQYEQGVADGKRDERARWEAMEYLSQAKFFIQNPDTPIGEGWLITINVDRYRNEVTYHNIGELPETCESLPEAISMLNRDIAKIREGANENGETD